MLRDLIALPFALSLASIQFPSGPLEARDATAELDRTRFK
jgi:hypothetical protein